MLLSQLCLLAKEEIVYKQLENKRDLIHKLIQNQTGFDADIVVKRELFNNKIDLTSVIDFDIEKE